MSAREQEVVQALAGGYVDTFPDEVADELERLPVSHATALVDSLDPRRAGIVVNRLGPDRASEVLEALHGSRAARLVEGMDPGRAAHVLARIPTEVRRQTLSALPEGLATELDALIEYPPDSAGSMMDPQVTTFRPNTRIAHVLARLRALRSKRVQYVFVVDDESHLLAAVPLQEVATADPHQTLRHLVDGSAPPVSVQAMSSQTEVVDVLEEHPITAVPVVDGVGRLVGVIRSDALVHAAEAEASAQLQTMVGVSRDERALSPASFAVRKRLPWLNINLLTAFLAAAVVGLFESTIAQFTALAVLLPVVAGQSGNTGAQALAVTMRGLALREIRLRHWAPIALKEVTVGAVNGVAVALVTGLGVLLWSGSLGLAGVISVSMVVSMTIASLAGASVPMVLTVFKQDPAQASSIILTTVTDVMGFLSFLGLATLASGLL